MKPDDEVLISGHFIVLHSITVHNVPSAYTNVKAGSMEREAKGGRLNFKDLFHMYSIFGERIVFLFQEKKPRPHVRTYRFSPVHCLVPRPQYCAWPMRFGSRGPRKLLAVSRPFISDTSPECIDREGLDRRRTGIRQARPHVSVFDSRSPSTEFYVIDLTQNLFCSPLPFWAVHRVSLTHLLRSCPWVISWTPTL